MATTVQDVLRALMDNDGHHNITVRQLLDYITRASLLKREITQPQKATSSPVTPEVLPPSVALFLSESIDLPIDAVNSSWPILKEIIWASPSQEDVCQEDFKAFKDHGWKRGLTYHSIWPPTNFCTHPDCAHRKELKKEQFRQVVVYTLDHGACPAWSTHLYCRSCQTNYHHNYSVQNGVRRYYPGIPDYIQVGEHQFVEKAVVEMWNNMMLVAWVSASNCARIYNLSLSKQPIPTANDLPSWQFEFKLDTEHVWDAFVIYALLGDKDRMSEQMGQRVLLEVPHTGNQKDRFTAAMSERNERIIRLGQDELRHNCKRCMRTWDDKKGNQHKCQVIVTDGVTLGHPCCAIPHCQEELESNRHRFCRAHFDEHNNCAIIGCTNRVVHGSKVCADPEHVKIESLKKEKNKAAFQLKSSLMRSQVTHPSDSLPPDQDTVAEVEANPDIVIEGEEDEWYECLDGKVRIFSTPYHGFTGVQEESIPPADPTVCPSKSPTGNKKVKTRLSRRRTHNEQTIVRPCGVIVARATMNTAEAVSNTLYMVKRAMSVPGAQKPEHMIYDSNCDAKKQVIARNDTWFDDVGMCVDAWHFKCKHAKTDTFCQEHCNPANFPELMSEKGDGWYFNTSIAEQINVWLGGYLSICREMLKTKYNFFLDEMVRLRNVETVSRLEAQGYSPRLSPINA